jgi:hypothetical protein
VTATPGPLTYQVGNAGSVIVDATGGVLTLLAAIPSPGVVAVLTDSSTTALSIAFRSANGGSASCNLSLSGSQLSYQI